MAQRFGVDANKLHATLKATAFKGDVTNEQFLALMIVADQYKLNPLTREVFAFPDKNNGIVPVVSVDGWLRILNDHPQFNGMEFNDGPLNKEGLPEWIECVIYRRDREHPTKSREYMAECKRATGPWSSHPRRMLRHKSLIQCARLAMSLAGIYDEDEAQRVIEGTATVSVAAVDDLNAEIAGTAKRVDDDPAPQPAAPQPKQPAPATEEPAPAAASGDLLDVAPPAVDTSPGFEFTFAQVAAALNGASDGDAYNLAVDMIRGVADKEQRKELTALAKQRRQAVAS